MAADANKLSAPVSARLRANHPLRPPHWRWERAAMLRGMGRQTLRAGEADTWTTRAFNLQSNLAAAGDDIARCKALEDADDLGIAFEIWDDMVGSPTVACGTRVELEARILARQPIDAISQHFYLPVEVIAAYQECFFDVADRLDNVGYITHNVIGPTIYNGMSDKDLKVLVRAYAYHTQSTEVIDTLVTTFNGNPKPDGDNFAFYCEDAKWSIARKAALAARMLPMNSFSHLPILEAHAANVANAPPAPQGGGILENVQVVIGSLPYHCGAKSDPNQFVEPRAIEMLPSDLGGVPASGELLTKFPPAEIPPLEDEK